MTWEQKLLAMQALTEVSLKMRKPGDWYVDARGRRVKAGVMSHGIYGNGKNSRRSSE
jgi:hypothetical protein